MLSKIIQVDAHFGYFYKPSYLDSIKEGQKSISQQARKIGLKAKITLNNFQSPFGGYLDFNYLGLESLRS